MKIIFDFDHTVFDMTAMHQSIVDAIKELGINEEQYRHCYNDVTNWKIFTVDSISQRLNRVLKVSSEDVSKAFHVVAEEALLYVYDDVDEHFQKLKAEGHKLYLLSWGDKDWQHKKIEHSGLMKHCEDIMTVQEVKADYLSKNHEQHECLVLIDDKPAELKAIKEAKPDLKMIRLRRDNGKYSGIETPHDIPEAKNMAEVMKIVSEMKCALHD